jgi:hypothetical protein
MQTFHAEVKMDYDTFLIDWVPAMSYNNYFRVWSFARSTGVYVDSLQAAMDVIGEFNDRDIEQLTLDSELAYNR